MGLSCDHSAEAAAARSTPRGGSRVWGRGGSGGLRATVGQGGEGLGGVLQGGKSKVGGRTRAGKGGTGGWGSTGCGRKGNVGWRRWEREGWGRSQRWGEMGLGRLSRARPVGTLLLPCVSAEDESPLVCQIVEAEVYPTAPNNTCPQRFENMRVTRWLRPRSPLPLILDPLQAHSFPAGARALPQIFNKLTRDVSWSNSRGNNVQWSCVFSAGPESDGLSEFKSS